MSFDTATRGRYSRVSGNEYTAHPSPTAQPPWPRKTNTRHQRYSGFIHHPEAMRRQAWRAAQTICPELFHHTSGGQQTSAVPAQEPHPTVRKSARATAGSPPRVDSTNPIASHATSRPSSRRGAAAPCPLRRQIPPKPWTHLTEHLQREAELAPPVRLQTETRGIQPPQPQGERARQQRRHRKHCERGSRPGYKPEA